MIRHGSLFSGIGGFDLGMDRAGMQTVWAVEIDPHCRRVLRHHWPGLHIENDIHDVGAHNLTPVDVITFGFPCQDLSVAGRRAGLAGNRSGLFWEAMRVVRELRPTLALVENVPGLLSSNGGRDMAAVLWGFLDAGARDVGWAVLDAQWFGVAQRRRRVFVVGDFGGERAAEILALSDGLSGHPAPRREARQDVAGILGGGTGARGWPNDLDRMTYIPTQAGTLAAGAHPSGFNGQDAYQDRLIAHMLRSKGADASEDGTGRGTPLVAFTNRGNDTGASAETLRAGSHGALPMVVRTAQTSATGHGVAEDVTHTLDGSGGQAVACVERTRVAGRNFEAQDELAYALTNPGSGGRTHSRSIVTPQMVVRRLTPRECERLQGFPDDWTLVPRELKQRQTRVRWMSDSARYRMLGNAVCVNVAEWLGRRIVAALDEVRIASADEEDAP
jgi:DNA (cytosine-5)-methyltransferase 1